MICAKRIDDNNVAITFGEKYNGADQANEFNVGIDEGSFSGTYPVIRIVLGISLRTRLPGINEPNKIPIVNVKTFT